MESFDSERWRRIEEEKNMVEDCARKYSDQLCIETAVKEKAGVTKSGLLY